MGKRSFRTADSYEAERTTRDMLSGFLSCRGFRDVRDERDHHGKTESQTLRATAPIGERLAMRVRLCWRRTRPSSQKASGSAAQLLSKVKDDDWEGALSAKVERERAEGVTHFLIVQREGDRVACAALVPVEALVTIWCAQRDASGALIKAGKLGRRTKNHAMNGSSPAIWLRDDRAPSVAAALWDHPGVQDLAQLPAIAQRGSGAREDEVESGQVGVAVNYFIIGTKYAGWTAEPRDVYGEMLEAGAVSIGYASECDLSPVFGMDEEAVRAYLKKTGIEGDAFRYLRKLASVKPGDMIALKKIGSPVGRKARLLVCAYAVVVRRDGVVYRHEPQGLGHLINVDFLERDIAKEFELGYGQTIHRLTGQDHIKAVFGPYAQSGSAPGRALRKGTCKKKTTDAERVVSGGRLRVSKAHDRMQQSLFNHLVRKHGGQNVEMESGHADIMLQERGDVTLFEVKPHMSVTLCVREALGQLLEYGWRLPQPSRVKELVVVGYSRATEKEKAFVEHVQRVLLIPLRYMAWPHA